LRPVGPRNADGFPLISAPRKIRAPKQAITIASRDYWFNPLDNQQINWSLVDDDAGGGCTAYFRELSGVFDRLTFASRAQADQLCGVTRAGAVRNCANSENYCANSPPGNNVL
jgi:hypothetical protein